MKKVGLFCFFSGIGVLDLGFESLGFDPVYASEINDKFVDGHYYSRLATGMRPPKYGYGIEDINTLLSGDRHSRLAELIRKARQEYDLIGFIGGPPCPDFSIGGKNKGKEGEHGALSESYIKLIIEHKPDFFLFENVKGLWQTKRHREFYDELKRKVESEHYSTTDRLINAIEFGAPQDRERIILIGFSQKRFQIDQSHRLNSNEQDIDWFPWTKHIRGNRDVIFSLPWTDTSPFKQESAMEMPLGIAGNLTVEHWFRRNGVNEHANAVHCFTPRAGLAKFLVVREGDVSRKSYKRLHRWRYSPTAAYGNNEVHLHPYRARRISVAEALAIQSLPKAFELPMSMTLSDMFKSVGNAVPYLAAQGLAKSIKTFIEDYNASYSRSNRFRYQRA